MSGFGGPPGEATRYLPPLTVRPFTDQNGILQPWAAQMLQRLFTGIVGTGGILENVASNTEIIDNLTVLSSAPAPSDAPTLAALQVLQRGVAFAAPPTGAALAAIEGLQRDLAFARRPAPVQGPVTLGSGAQISDGYGAPNGVVYGNIGDLYLRRDGGASTALYVKESGAGTDVGWIGK